jgi:hypothetical protein
MSIRERWIVYPLLFLSLGISLRDQFLPSMRMRPGLSAAKLRCIELECQDLTVTGPDGSQRIRLGVTSKQAGQIELYDRHHRMLVVAGADPSGKSGSLETFAAEGKPLVRLRATDHGGMVSTVNRDGKVDVCLGYESTGPGVYAVMPQTGRSLMLTLPWWKMTTLPETAK